MGGFSTRRQWRRPGATRAKAGEVSTLFGSGQGLRVTALAGASFLHGSGVWGL